MSSQEGRQSPPPERQTGPQLKDAPASGQGVHDTPNKKEDVNEQVKNLESNPKAPMDKALNDKFTKDTQASS